MHAERRTETQPESLQKLLGTEHVDTLSDANLFLERWARAFPGGRMHGVDMKQATRLFDLKKVATEFKNPKTAEATIRAILADNARPMNFVEIHAAQTRYTVGTIRQVLSTLRSAGILTRVKEGYFALPEHVDAPFIDTYHLRSRTPKGPRKRKLRTGDELILDFFSENEEGGLLKIFAWKEQHHPGLMVNAAHLVETLDTWTAQGVLTTSHASGPRSWRRVDEAFRELKEETQPSAVLR